MTRGDHRIDKLLDELAREDRRIEPPDGLEARVLRAWDERASESDVRSPRTSTWRWAVIGGAMAASVVAALLVWDRGAGSVPSTVSSTADVPAPSEQYLQWLDDDPASLRVVRLRVARDTLTSMGVAVVQGDARDVVEVELVVGPDGARRAARLLPAMMQEDF